MRPPDDNPDIAETLHRSVASLEPTPALNTIQRRIKENSMSTSHRPWIFAAAAAAAAVTAVAVGVAVLGDNDPQSPPVAASSSPSPTPPAKPTKKPQPSPSPSSKPTAAPAPEMEQRTVTVFYLGDTSRSVGLFTEPATVEAPVGEPAVSQALDLMFNGATRDPDYRTPWPGTPDGLTVTAGDTVTVEMSGGGNYFQRPEGVSKVEARLGLDQLAATVQAAVGKKVGVEVIIDGRRATTLLGVPLTGPFQPRPAAKTEAPVWITSPAHGDTVDSDFEVTGRGAFFEANVSWQLLGSNGSVAAEGFATATQCCTLSPYSFLVTDVAPGTYTLRVYDADVSGGEGGPENEDTKSVTVN